MPADIPALFVELKNRLLQPDEWVFLFEVRSPTDGPIIGPNGEAQILRLASRTLPVEFGTNKETGAPLVWSPWPAKLGDVSDDTKGNINDITLSFSNALRAADALMADNSYLRDHRLYIHIVHAALLANPAAVFTIPTTIVDATIGWDTISLRLSAFAFLDFTVPQRIMTRKCGWAYRGPGCAFVGDPGNAELGPCSFDIEACRARGAWEADNGLPVLHPARFGGFPALLAGPLHASTP